TCCRCQQPSRGLRPCCRWACTSAPSCMCARPNGRLAMADGLAGLKVSNSFAELPEAYYSRVSPSPPSAPCLLHANPDVARLLGLDEAVLGAPEFLALCAGQAPLPGGQTIATVYSGHQFGVWAGQLGDGRAHLLGEIQGPAGSWEIQLKGS